MKDGEGGGGEEREPGGKSPPQAFFEGSFLCQILN